MWSFACLEGSKDDCNQILLRFEVAYFSLNQSIQVFIRSSHQYHEQIYFLSYSIVFRSRVSNVKNSCSCSRVYSIVNMAIESFWPHVKLFLNFNHHISVVNNWCQVPVPWIYIDNLSVWDCKPEAVKQVLFMNQNPQYCALMKFGWNLKGFWGCDHVDLQWMQLWSWVNTPSVIQEFAAVCTYAPETLDLVVEDLFIN